MNVRLRRLGIACVAGVTAVFALVIDSEQLQGQGRPGPSPAPIGGVFYRALPTFSRGGRVTAVAGVPADQQVYYMGTPGGVWKTTNAGAVWEPVTDGQIGVGTIGAIAVADSNPSVVYVGTGSACPRGNVSL